MSAGDKSAGKRPDPIRQCTAAALISLVCGIFATQLGQIYVEPTDAGIGARGLPTFVLVAGLALSAGLLVSNLPQAICALRRGGCDHDWRAGARIAALTLIAFGYVRAITLFQYALPTAVAMSAMLYLFGSRGIFRLAVIPVLAVAAYWFVFFVLLGMFEAPGSLLHYDSYTLALRVRQFIGLQ